MLSAAPEQQAANAARRRSMLQDLHARIASGDVEARDKALQALRELDNLAPALPPGVPVPLPVRASKAAAAATAVREDKMDQVAANTKVYMHGRHMEQLNQAIQLEQAARWKADVLDAYASEDPDWGVALGKAPGQAAAEKVAAAAAAAAAAKKPAAVDKYGRPLDADGDLIDDEDELDDEEYEFYRAKSTKRIMMLLRLAVVLALIGLVVGGVAIFHMRVYQCSFQVGQPGSFSKVLHRNFSALNVKKIFVYKSAGHVAFSVDDESDQIRVEVTHFGRTLDVMNQLESRIYQERGMVSVLSSWPLELEGGFACPQADVRVMLPRAIADGVLRQRMIWDPNANGIGRGAYMEPEPVPVENRPDIEVVVNGTFTSWMLPRRGNVHVELADDVAFANVSLQSNLGDVTVTRLYGDHVRLRSDGSNVNASRLRCGTVYAECGALDFYTPPADVWPWLVISVWPAFYRHVGQVFMDNIDHCEPPCLAWVDAEEQLEAAAAAIRGSRQAWLSARNDWTTQAYYTYVGHAGRYALQPNANYWDGRFLEEMMWISFDLGRVYTISGLRITGVPGGGLAEQFELQAISQSNGSWAQVAQFRGAPTIGVQEFLGFEGTAQTWRILVDGTYAKTIGGVIEESSSSLRVQDHTNVVLSGWQELGQWPVQELASGLSWVSFDPSSGRMTAALAGDYFVSANVEINNFEPVSVAVVRNSNVGLRSGMWQTLGADAPSRCLTMNGLMHLYAGDFLSLWICDHSDAGYTVGRQTSLASTKLDVVSGFGSSLSDGHALVAVGWTEVVGWTSSDENAHGGLLELGSGLDSATGRFTASVSGVYLVSSQLRVDGADTGTFRMLIGLDGTPDYDNGLHIAQGNPSPDYADFSVSGLLRMRTGSFVSVWVYVDEDSSCNVQKQSGFSCVQLETASGFGADLASSQAVASSVWTEVVNWETAGAGGRAGLFALGLGFDATTGRFTARADGVFVASAQVVLEHPSGGAFALTIAVDGNTDIYSGMRTVSERTSSGILGLSTSGVVQLKAAEYISTWVQASVVGVSSCTVQSSSGFACAELSTLAHSQVTRIGPSTWTEIEDWSAVFSTYGWAATSDSPFTRFTAPMDGIVLVSATVSLGEADYGLFHSTIAVRGTAEYDGGLHLMSDFLSQGHASLIVSGALQLNKNEYVSSWIEGENDLDFYVRRQSRFACAMVEPSAGFAGDLSSDLAVSSIEWVSVQNWALEGVGRSALFEVGSSFDAATGRFAARVSAVYYASTQLSLQGCTADRFTATIAMNDRPETQSVHQVISTMEDSRSTLTQGVHVSGALYLQAGDFISIWVHSSNDPDYVLSSFSGFSAVLLESPAGFAGALRSDVMITSSAWTELGDWRILPVEIPGLFSIDNRFDPSSGRFTPLLEFTGTFMVSARVVIDGRISEVAAGVVVNGFTDDPANVIAVYDRALEGTATVTISGIMALNDGDAVSLWVKHETPLTVLRSTSFSCAQINTEVAVSANRVSQGWVELNSWPTIQTGPGSKGFFADDSGFEPATGRFTARGGIYLASTQVTIARADDSYFRVLIGLNARPDINNGLQAINGRPSIDLADFSITGVLQMQAGDFISVWIYSTDLDYIVTGQSSFSCALLETSSGFGADLSATQAVATVGWTEVAGWETAGSGGRGGLFELGSGLDSATGRFTASVSGVYLVSSQLRVDGADTGTFRMLIGLDGTPDYDNGLHIAQGNPSPDYADFSVSGLVELQSGSFVSVWIYSQDDVKFTVNSQSGFFGALLNVPVAFSGEMSRNQLVDTASSSPGTPWTKVRMWETAGDGPRSHLFSTGEFEEGEAIFVAGSTGAYLFAAQIAIGSGLGDLGAAYGAFDVALVVDGDTELATSLKATNSHVSETFSDFSMAGVVYLQAGETVSLWVHARQDSSFLIMGQSGFAGAFLGQIEGASAAVAHSYWKELHGWRVDGLYADKNLFQQGDGFDVAAGRFTVSDDALYLMSTHVRMDNADHGYFRVGIGLNGAPDVDNGMSVIDGHPEPGFADFTISGVMNLVVGDYVSVWAYAYEDDDFETTSQSGFSCLSLNSVTGGLGFGADLVRSQSLSAGWTEIGGWSTAGTDGRAGLYEIGAGFDRLTGRYSATMSGIYYAGAQIRLDEADVGTFGISLSLNGDVDRNNALYAVDGLPAPDYSHLSVSGVFRLQADDFVSVWLYASGDRVFFANSQSGFSCARLDTSIGFAADLAEEKRVTSAGWTELQGWETSGVNGRISLFLANADRNFDDRLGRYSAGDGVATKDGHYFCAANIALSEAEQGHFKVAIVMNGNPSTENGLHATNAKKSPIKGFSVSGMLHLDVGDFVSVWVFSQADSDFVVHTHSGFSCALLPTADGFSADLPSPRSVTEYREWASKPIGSLVLPTAADFANGRYTAQQTATYFVSAQMVIMGAAGSAVAAGLNINAMPSHNNGLHTVTGSVDNFSTLRISGAVILQQDDFVSVWLYSSQDVSFTVSGDSSFSCALLETSSGFGADLSATQAVATVGWTEVAGWETAGSGGRGGLFELGSGLDSATGRFTASVSGVYLVSSQLRVDGADTGTFRMLIGLDGTPDYDNGLHIAQGNPSPDYADFSVSGLVELQSGSFVSVWIYSQDDVKFTVNSQSGFSCVQLETASGFGADLASSQAVASSVWTEVVNWETAGAGGRAGLFALGVGFDATTGRFTARADGVFVASAQVVLEHPSGGAFALTIAVDGNTDIYSGMRTVSERTSSGILGLSTSGVVQLKAAEYISTWVQASVVGVSSCTVQSSSGFACGQLVSPGAAVAARNPVWSEVKPFEEYGQISGAFSIGSDLDYATGRYTAPAGGYFVVSANIFLHSTVAEVAKACVALNALPDADNGLFAMSGVASSGTVAFTLSGAVQMYADDFVSVWVSMHGAPSYGVSDESSFSCALLETSSGFGADLSATQAVATVGWTEVAGWETAGSGGRGGLFELGSGLDSATGRFTASVSGVYLVSSQLRVDGADTGTFRMLIGLDGTPDYDNGLHIAQGNPSPDYADFSVSGLVELQSGSFVSVWIYSQDDVKFTVNSQSGFSCVQLETASGFGADLASSQAVASSVWTEVVNWETAGAGGRAGLFALGVGFDATTGRFTASLDALYFAAARLATEHAADVSAVLALNAMAETPSVLTSPTIGTDSVALSGMFSMGAGDFLSVIVRSRLNSTIGNTSGFSCALVSTPSKGPALAYVQFYGHTGQPQTAQAFGNIEIRSDEGDILCQNVSDMNLDIRSEREAENPYCPIPDDPNGIPEKPVGHIHVSAETRGNQGPYMLHAPGHLGTARIETDQDDTVFPTGSVFFPTGTRYADQGPLLTGRTGNVGMQQEMRIYSENGAISVALNSDTYNRCPHDCWGRGRCFSDGSCSCFSGYSGIDCYDQSCPNDCSGRGTCDDWNGVCICDPRFTGADCSQITCPDLRLGGNDIVGDDQEACLICPSGNETCDTCRFDLVGQCVYGMSAPSITSIVEIRFLLDQTTRRRTNVYNGTQLQETVANMLGEPLALMRGAATFTDVEVPSWLWSYPVCTVTLFGDANFSGWSATYEPGRYSMAALEMGGGTDNDMESIRVSWGCTVQLWQFSWGGWRHTLFEGDYNATEIAETGVEINAVSAMIVTQTDFAPRPITTEATIRLVAELPQARSFTPKVVPEDSVYMTMPHPEEGHDIQVLPVLPEWGLERSALRPLRLDGFGDVSQVDVIVHCPNDCSRNALSCDTTWGRCKCLPGFFRDDCALQYCPEDCNGRGQCNHHTGQCTCDPRYQGLACQEIRCTADCSGPHNLGQCDLTTGRCACAPPSYGDTCEHLQCPGNCSAPVGGRCDSSNGQCNCEPGRLFADCSGQQCSHDTATITIVATANATAMGFCSIPHDNDAGLREALRTSTITCEAAFQTGLCASPTVQKYCTCACKSVDDSRPCHYGALTDYEGDVSMTDSGVRCAPWDGRDGVPSGVSSCRLPASSGASTPWCYTAPSHPPVQLRSDFSDSRDHLCLTHDRYHPESLAEREVPVAWAPCINATANPLVWVDGPDYDLAMQLWALDGGRGVAEPWSWAATNRTSPQLVVNEVGYGPARRHLVPLLMPTENYADAIAPSAVHRLRMESEPDTLHWGDAGCHGHGLCDVLVGACECFSGFGGSECSVEVNECYSRPCHHGGACIEGQRAGTYACICTADAFGGDCERWTTVQASIVLEGDMATVGTVGSPERNDFENTVATDLSILLEVAQSRIVIDGVASGSIIVDFSIRADDVGEPVASAVVLNVLGADSISIAGLQVQEISVTRPADGSTTQVAMPNGSSSNSSGHDLADADMLEASDSDSGSGSDSSSASWSE